MEHPRLVPTGPQKAANVAVVRGLPWYYSESDAGQDLGVFGMPKTVRLYEDPLNGSSRGIVYVEYESAQALIDLKATLKTVGPYPVTAELYHLTSQRWDRTGRLPRLPGDEEMSGRIAEGYGPQGFAVRGVGVSLPNTVTPEGIEQLERCRKRLRAE